MIGWTVRRKLWVPYLLINMNDEIKKDIDEKLKIAFEKYLSKYPEAANWAWNFRHLSHALDDLVDVPERRADNEFIGLLTNKYIELLSADFYSKNRHKLYSAIKLCHHVYFDSVAWEKSTIEWKRNYADIIRCATNHAIVMVVEIAVTEQLGSADLGYEAAREVSLLVREKSYYDHHDSEGKPI